jgi:hypothetical protein
MTPIQRRLLRMPVPLFTSPWIADANHLRSRRRSVRFQAAPGDETPSSLRVAAIERARCRLHTSRKSAARRRLALRARAVQIGVIDLLVARTVKCSQSPQGAAGRNTRGFSCIASTMVQEVYASHPDIARACEARICGHASTLEVDIAAAMKRYRSRAGGWTAPSLAQHT